MSSPLWLMRAFSSLASNSRSGNNIVLHTAHPHTRAFSSLLRNLQDRPSDIEGPGAGNRREHAQVWIGEALACEFSYEREGQRDNGRRGLGTRCSPIACTFRPAEPPAMRTSVPAAAAAVAVHGICQNLCPQVQRNSPNACTHL